MFVLFISYTDDPSSMHAYPYINFHKTQATHV